MAGSVARGLDAHQLVWLSIARALAWSRKLVPQSITRKMLPFSCGSCTHAWKGYLQNFETYV